MEDLRWPTHEAQSTLQLETDDLRPVTLVAERRTGKRPSPSTIYRWVRRGTRGGRLEAVHVHGAWHTTDAAFTDFIRRQTAAVLNTQPRATSDTDEATLRSQRLL
jgi:hypothetical protein